MDVFLNVDGYRTISIQSRYQGPRRRGTPKTLVLGFVLHLILNQCGNGSVSTSITSLIAVLDPTAYRTGNLTSLEQEYP